MFIFKTKGIQCFSKSAVKKCIQQSESKSKLLKWIEGYLNGGHTKYYLSIQKIFSVVILKTCDEIYNELVTMFFATKKV